MSCSPTDESSAIPNRIRRLIYQASYTGMKETDLLLGHFARLYLPRMSNTDLTDFENLLEAGDHSIYAWVMGNIPVPAAYDTPVFQLIKRYKDKK